MKITNFYCNTCRILFLREEVLESKVDYKCKKCGRILAVKYFEGE